MTTKPRRYAENTGVSVEKSKMELDALLAKHGAKQRSFAQDDEGGRAVVVFQLAGRMARLELAVRVDDLPDPAKLDESQPKKLRSPQGWRTWSYGRRAEWCSKQAEQRGRASWRRLLLLVKAKLEIIAEGVSSFEREFLCDILLPDGRTVHQALEPQLAESYASGEMPKLLPPAR